MFNNFFRNCAICEIMWKKICRTGQSTDDNITRRMLVVCCILKITDTQLTLYILLFHYNNRYANVSEYYVVRALPAFFQNGGSVCEETVLSMVVQGLHLQTYSIR